MENSLKLLLDHLIVLLLEILASLAHILVGVWLLKLKYQLSKNSTLLKKVYHILIPLILKKCLFVPGKNSDILNNFT